MIGPSGFFLPSGPGSGYHESNDIELLHSSEDGFSELYRVCKNGRFFVYKSLKKEFRGNLLYENLLDKDFNIGFSLSHSGVCQYYAKITHPAVGNCIVMEWIDGCTLEELIRTGAVDSRLCKKIICEICDALDYIHRKQVIHRDLKPENILITHNGLNVKIIDFGLSDTDSYSTLKAPAGTRMYASPELIAGGPVDSRSDIWSLGVIINEMSGKYRHVASRCLSREIEKRYRSAEEVKTCILTTTARKLKISAIVLAILGAALFVFFIMSERNEVTEIAEPQASSEDAIATPSPVQKEEVKAEESARKPQTKSVATPARDNRIDADELDQLFKDAAETIL